MTFWIYLFIYFPSLLLRARLWVSEINVILPPSLHKGTIYPVTRLRRLLRAAIDTTQALEVPNSSCGVPQPLSGGHLEKRGFLTCFLLGPQSLLWKPQAAMGKSEKSEISPRIRELIGPAEANEPQVSFNFVTTSLVRLSPCLCLTLGALTTPISCPVAFVESLIIGLYSASFIHSFTQCLLFVWQVLGLGLGATARNIKGQKYSFSWSWPWRRQTRKNR